MNSFCRAAVVGIALVSSVAPAFAASGTPVVLLQGEILLRSWQAPRFPSGLPAEVRAGAALVRAVVNADGTVRSARVLSESAPEFGAAALQAVRSWVFAPPQRHDAALACGVDIPFQFDRDAVATAHSSPAASVAPRLSPHTPARALEVPPVPFDERLRRRAIDGFVRVRGVIGPDGKVASLSIADATDVEFAEAALRASAAWRFAPAQEGDLAIEGDWEDELVIAAGTPPGRRDALTRNGITAPATFPDTALPKITGYVEPVAPAGGRGRAMAGAAEVEFTLDMTRPFDVSRPRDIRIKAAAAPALGEALVAAVRGWQFSFPVGAPVDTAVSLTARVAFPAEERDAAPDRLIAAAQLDAPLECVYQPRMPNGPWMQSGVAVVECVIDARGRVVSPRAVDVAAPDIAAAVVTVAAQRLFMPPMSAGRPCATPTQLRVAF